MKKSLVAVALLFSTSALVAVDWSEGWFIGGEFGGVNNKLEENANIFGSQISNNAKLNTTYEAIKVGKYFDSSRVYAKFGYQNEKDDYSSYTVTLGYNYLFKTQSDFTPFAGLNIAYTNGKLDLDNLKIKPDGFEYGVEAGVLYAFNKNLELELGVRYMFSDAKDTKNNINNLPISYKLESEHVFQYYLGLNYKF